MKCSLAIPSFLEEISVFPILLFSSISLHWSLKRAFLSLLAILWNSAFKGAIVNKKVLDFFFPLFFISWRLITLQYWKKVLDFHWLNPCQERRGVFLLPLGLSYRHSAWELPLLISELYLSEVSVYQLFTSSSCYSFMDRHFFSLRLKVGMALQRCSNGSKWWSLYMPASN